MGLGDVNEQMPAKLSAELAHIKTTWWVLPEWVMVVALVIATGSMFYFVSFPARLLGVLAAIYFASQVAYRLGVYHGCAHGFQQGHEVAVDGLTTSPAQALQQNS